MARRNGLGVFVGASIAVVWILCASCGVATAQGKAPPPPPLPPGAAGALAAGTVDDRPMLVIDPQGYVDDVMGLSFSPDGRFLAAAAGKEIRIWDLSTRSAAAPFKYAPPRTLRGERSRGSMGNCFAVAFTPDGRELVVGFDDYSEVGSIRVYDTANLDEIKQVVPGHRVPVRKLALSRDGRHLASAGENGDILLWDWPARKVVGTIKPTDPKQPLYSYFDFPTEKPILLVGSAAGPELYSVPKGQRLGPQDVIPDIVRRWFAVVPQGAYPDKGGPDILFNPLDQTVWFAGGTSDTKQGMKYWVSMWGDVKEAPTKPVSPTVTYRGHRWTIRSMALSRDGKTAASADRFGEVHLWDPATGSEKTAAILKATGRPIYSVGFQPGADAARGNDLSTMRVLYGATPFSGPQWSFNHYAKTDRMLDLGKRALGTIDPIEPPAPISPPGLSLTAEVKAEIYQLTARQGGQALGTHEISAGHIPMAFGYLAPPRFDTKFPAVLSTDSGALYVVDPVTDKYRRWFIGHGASVTSFQESPDRRLLLSSSTDRTLRFWSLLDGPKEFLPAGDFGFRYQSNVVMKLRPEAPAGRQGFRVGDKILDVDGKSLTEWEDRRLAGKLHVDYPAGKTIPVKIERGGRPQVLNLTLVDGYDSVEPTLNVFISDEGEWIVWTPQGYYDASPGGDRLIGWHVNQGRTKAAKFFQAEQFRKLMYRPDIIDRVLQTGRLDESIAEANKLLPRPPESLDLRKPEVLKRLEPPTVKFLEPADGLSLTVNKAAVKAVIESPSGQPLREVRLLINGRPVGAPIELERNATRYALNQELTLSPGRNDVQIVATNGTSDSQAKGIALFAPRATGPKPNLYVLSIGVSQFQNQNLKLKFADKDALAFDQLVRQNANGNVFGNVTTKLLTNQQATSANILQELSWLQKSATAPNDVAMLFVSSHGFFEERKYYLGSHNVDPEKLLATAVTVTQIQDVLKELRCRVVMFVDTCHAGGIGGGLGSSDPYRDFTDEQVGVVVYCSSTHREDSVEDEKWGHGAFTKALLDAAADPVTDHSPKDGALGLTEVQGALIHRVDELTRKAQHVVVGRPPTVTEFQVMQAGVKLNVAAR